MIKKICVFTGTRADYGLLKPLIEEMQKDATLCLQIIVSGMHLSPEFGLTYRMIESDGFRIDEKIEILMSSDSSVGLCKSVGLGLISFCEALDRLKPDMLVVLGDRFEAFSVTSAAMMLCIPIAHIHGGEVTQGVIDESIRHSITKMSHLHFASAENYRQRIIQLGEQPERVFNVGALGVEAIRKLKLLNRADLEKTMNFSIGKRSILVTFHPVTLEKETSESKFSNLLKALEAFPELKIIFTKANADTDGRVINRMIDDYVARNSKKAVFYTSMGQMLYLSAMRHVDAVVGNSSSGIIEAPCFRVPSVNIGDRQKGRIRAKSVIDCDVTEESICAAVHKAFSNKFKQEIRKVINPYEKENTALRIKNVIKSFDLNDILKKEFYDLRIG